MLAEIHHRAGRPDGGNWDNGNRAGASPVRAPATIGPPAVSPAVGVGPSVEVGPAVEVGADPWAGARCRDGSATMVGLFFSEQLDDIARAKAICAQCPLAAPCLEGALERGEPWGVWGGQLFANGRVLAFKRKRGRPPKADRAQLTA